MPTAYEFFSFYNCIHEAVNRWIPFTPFITVAVDIWNPSFPFSLILNSAINRGLTLVKKWFEFPNRRNSFCFKSSTLKSEFKHKTVP